MSKWTYNLTVTNLLDTDLELVSEHVPWGSKDGSFPKVIKPKESKTFSVYSAAGLAWGLEFYISMQKKLSNADKKYGGFDFFVDMPLYGKNRSEFNTYGLVEQTGFEYIPERQHDFSTTVKVFDFNDDDATKDSEKVGDYCKSLYDWQTIEKISYFNEDEALNDLIPKKNCLANRMVVGRSKELIVPKNMWKSIIDKKYKDEYTKHYFLDNYFTVAAYEIRKSKVSVDIHAKQSLSKTVEISHHSEIRRETSQEFLLENIAKFDKKSDGLSFSDVVKAQYKISHIDEYCEGSSVVEKQEIKYEPDDRDRVALWWDVVKVVALYRKRKNGICELVGLEDYYMLTVPKTYYCDTQTEA